MLIVLVLSLFIVDVLDSVVFNRYVLFLASFVNRDGPSSARNPSIKNEDNNRIERYGVRTDACLMKRSTRSARRSWLPFLTTGVATDELSESISSNS